MRLIFYLLAMLIATSLHAQKKANLSKSRGKAFLDSILNTNEQLKPLLQRRKELNIQVIYTKIDRDSKNEPHFTDYSYQLNNERYFYPASTVKMPIAFLALEKLNSLKQKGVNKHTAMLTDSSSEKQSKVYTHPSAENSVPSIAHYIKQIFLVSDNDAFNRLYEFLGQEYIKKQLKKKGYPDVIIRHRLQTPLTVEQNKLTNPVSFHDTSGNMLYEQPLQYSEASFEKLDVRLGRGFYRGDQLINEPFDFSLKNRIYLQDLHNILRSVLFPEAYSSKQQFDLTKDDMEFLLHWMSAYPTESKYPSYDSSQYWDAYCKFMLFGSEKKQVPKHIRIFNKPGDAYGFLTDIAYVVDLKSNIEFMLSATISCNSDGIYNDDKYDYETIGFPFMKSLGETIYKYELQRESKHKPDLTKFTINYQQQ
jgi:disulfide oxidoreductase YuzD